MITFELIYHIKNMIFSLLEFIDKKIFQLKILIPVFITLNILFPSMVSLNNIWNKNEYKYLNKHYEWMTYNYYKILKIATLRQKYNNKPLDIVLVSSIINIESHGRNIRSQQNKNGTYDYGVFQVNEVHANGNPQKLYDKMYNANLGCKYLAGALKIARGNLGIAIRLYNQGWSGKAHNYKQWVYVVTVLSKYIETKEDLSGS